MGPIRDDQLYPLMYKLSQHFQKHREIEGLEEIPEQLQKTLQRMTHRNFETPPGAEHEVSDPFVCEVVAGLEGSPDLSLQIYEDGPFAKRAKTQVDLKSEQDEEEARIAALKREFFISIGYSIPAIVGSRTFFGWYADWQRSQRNQKEEAVIQTTNKPQLLMHPYQMGGFALILVAAWGMATAWQIANEVWIDWTNAKAAIPVIGKAWAERSKKAKEEETMRRKRERAMRNKPDA